jgi:hypothetical protein
MKKFGINGQWRNKQSPPNHWLLPTHWQPLHKHTPAAKIRLPITGSRLEPLPINWQPLHTNTHNNNPPPNHRLPPRIVAYSLAAATQHIHAATIRRAAQSLAAAKSRGLLAGSRYTNIHMQQQSAVPPNHWLPQKATAYSLATSTQTHMQQQSALPPNHWLPPRATAYSLAAATQTYTGSNNPQPNHWSPRRAAAYSLQPLHKHTQAATIRSPITGCREELPPTHSSRYTNMHIQQQSAAPPNHWLWPRAAAYSLAAATQTYKFSNNPPRRPITGCHLEPPPTHWQPLHKHTYAATINCTITGCSEEPLPTY